MSNEIMNISYPSVFVGTQNSEIAFYSGEPDLEKLFYKENSNEIQRRFFVTDANIASLDCMQSFIQKFDDGVYEDDFLLILGSGEKYKTVESALTIITTAVEADFSRNDVFVGIGGGVICDITAFAASIFKRGARVRLVPTTFLAMVDASVGGKTGCDYDNYKNTIGTFFPAQKLYYFPEFAQYLPENQFNSGLAEAFKTAILFDKELYDIFKNESEKINSRDKDLLKKIIIKCVKAKSAVVEQDFTEQGIRAFLNLGHTFAHALESILGLGNVTHGFAVAWGIGRAADLSYKKEYCSRSFRDEIFDILKKYNWETNAIPAIVKGGGIGERLLSAMRKDKKNFTKKVRIVLPKNVNQIDIEEIDDKEILSALK